MIEYKTYPCAKINIGLNVIEKRSDGFHDIETVFVPIPLYDELTINVQENDCMCEKKCVLTTNGIDIACENEQNIVFKAYSLLDEKYNLPCIAIDLKKQIPSQAGLGGGSSDGAFTLIALNKIFNLGLTKSNLIDYCSQLGSDCAFFIENKPCFATGKGEILTPINNVYDKIKDMYLLLVKPDVAVSTKDAYSKIKPKKPEISCKKMIELNVDEWKNKMTNDFENPVFEIYPQLKEIKSTLYNMGATYAQMSGSGSTVYGLFENKPNIHNFEGMFVSCVKL